MRELSVIDDDDPADWHGRLEPLADTPRLREMQEQWDEDGRMLGAARERYRRHGNARLYRMECRLVLERDS